jgi:DnaJ family protein B protein 4
MDLSLRESLCGWKRTVSTIDGKQVNIEKQGPTQPGSREIYPDLGMPLSKTPHRRGNFIVTFEVKYLDSTAEVKLERNFGLDLDQAFEAVGDGELEEGQFLSFNTEYQY